MSLREELSKFCFLMFSISTFLVMFALLQYTKECLGLTPSAQENLSYSIEVFAPVPTEEEPALTAPPIPTPTVTPLPDPEPAPELKGSGFGGGTTRCSGAGRS